MLDKRFILLFLGFISAITSAQSEEWGRVKCLRECTDKSCTDPEKMRLCQTNCAHHPDTLEACKAAKAPQTTRAEVRKLPTPNAHTSVISPLVVKQPSLKTDEAGSPAIEESQDTQPDRPKQSAPQKQSEYTYTAIEVNNLLKGLLNDQIREVTTGCQSAVGRIKGGLQMLAGQDAKVEIVNERGKADLIDLRKTGNGFLELFEHEQKDANGWVKSFDVSKNLPEKDLKKYGIDKKDINFKEKLSLETLKKIYQKSQEKSLLVAQDCKVKSAQFQDWLEAYLAKKQAETAVTRKKSGFLNRSSKNRSSKK